MLPTSETPQAGSDAIKISIVHVGKNGCSIDETASYKLAMQALR
jgi:hypothetical protein